MDAMAVTGGRLPSIPFLKSKSKSSEPTAIPPPHISVSANHILRPLAKEKRTSKVRETTKMYLAFGSGNLGSLRGGAGLLERPSLDQSQFDPLPQIQEGGDIGRLSDKKGLGSGNSYRVLLIDDLRHTESLVEKNLPEVVPSVTVSDARKLFHESRQNGVAVVIVTVKEHAEFYSQMMIRKGLRSAIEPDANMA